MRKQKIIKVGNSRAVVIPKEVFDAYELKDSSSFTWDSSRQEGPALQLIPNKKLQKYSSTESSVNSEFLGVLKKVNKQYASALKKLAEK